MRNRASALLRYAAQHRSWLTPSEEALWLLIRGGRTGAWFRRQVVLGGRFIADFVAPAARLVVEVDGGYHARRRAADARRDRALARLGYEWERAGKRLLASGTIDRACSLAVRGAVRRGEDWVSDHHWKLLLACGHRDPRKLWRALRESFDEDAAGTRRLAMGIRFHGSIEFPADEVLTWVGRNEERAFFACALVPVHHGGLHALAEGLITRFGAASPIGLTLASAMKSTYEPVHSLAEFYKRQARRVETLRTHPHAQIRAWASKLLAALREHADFSASREELERRRYGT